MDKITTSKRKARKTYTTSNGTTLPLFLENWKTEGKTRPNAEKNFSREEFIVKKSIPISKKLFLNSRTTLPSFFNRLKQSDSKSSRNAKVVRMITAQVTTCGRLRKNFNKSRGSFWTKLKSTIKRKNDKYKNNRKMIKWKKPNLEPSTWNASKFFKDPKNMTPHNREPLSVCQSIISALFRSWKSINSKKMNRNKKLRKWKKCSSKKAAGWRKQSMKTLFNTS